MAAILATADSVNNNAKLQANIDVIVKEQLEIINSKIINHNVCWGRNVITYQLPINFVVNGLQKRDAQRIVYSKTISDLKKRKFEVRITLDPNDDKNLLYIAWKVGYDDKECSNMRKVIDDHIMEQHEIDAWVDRE